MKYYSWIKDEEGMPFVIKYIEFEMITLNKEQVKEKYSFYHM